MRMLTILLVAVALAACSGADAGREVELPPLSYEGYLEHEIPPCTPVEGGSVDPCGEEATTDGTGEGAVGRDAPFSVRNYLDGGRSGVYDTPPPHRKAHLVVRGTYLPNTVRCASHATTDKAIRTPTYTSHARDLRGENLYRSTCFIDVRVNAYIVGTGPSKLPVVVSWSGIPLAPEHTEAWRQRTEASIIDRLPGHERIMFLGPTLDFAFATFTVWNYWKLEERDDGTVIAVHPNRFYWQREHPTNYNHLVEMTLADFTTAAQAAQTARLAEDGGRIGSGANLPMLITDAHQIMTFHTQAGNVNHPDGPPIGAAAPCGLGAVPNQLSTPQLMVDCMRLLEGVDQLRGTATLNWSPETAMSAWEGVSTSASGGGASGQSGASAGKVTKVELPNKGLTGSIPEELEALDLTTLKLSGNTLTGCIPPDLRDVATNDLAQLNLLYCSPAKPSLTAGSPGTASVPLSWAAVANATKYRIESWDESADVHTVTWVEQSSAITTTSYTVTGLSCGTRYRFRLSAFGSGTTDAAAWSDPSASTGVTTAQCAPVFGQESYVFSVAENAGQYSIVGTVAATDADGDTPTYHITAGNGARKFSIDLNAGFIVVRGTLDYETTSSYTLTVEARDGKGGVGSATVEITVTDVAE